MKPRPFVLNVIVNAVPQPMTMQRTPHPVVVETALHALAQLGATEALPVIDADINEGSVDSDNAKIERARLVAENEAKGAPSGRAQAAAKINRFYKELGLTSADINAAAVAYQSRPRGSRQSPPVEVYALQEIADMAYRGSYGDYAALPAVSPLSFQTDYKSALKMRLAPLTRGERVKAMIDDLAHSRYLGSNQSYEMQLLNEEGSLVGPAVAAQLHQMDGQRSQYPREGFEALFRSLSGTGDSAQAPLVEHYTHDQDRYIASFANNAYSDVKAGRSSLLAPDY